MSNHQTLSNAIRGQMIFRDHGSMAHNADYSDTARKNDTGTHVFIAMGVMEVPAGLFPDDHMRGIMIDNALGILRMEATGHQAEPTDLHYSRLVETSDMSGLMRQNMWRRPPMGMACVAGDILFRENRMPTASSPYPGNRRYVTFFGLISCPAAQAPKQDHMYHLVSLPNVPESLAFHIIDQGPVPALVEQTDRSVASSPLNMPLWGFEPEPYAIQSTLRLDILDMIEEMRGIWLKDDQTDEDKARFDLLQDLTGSIMHVGQNDSRFRAFCRMKREAGSPPSSKPLTTEELDHQESLSRQIIKQIMKEDGDSYAL